MKALVVRQPWATLIALGVKTIETRPGPPNGSMRPDGVRGLPGCTLERGERIAIVAGAAHGLPDRSVIEPYTYTRVIGWNGAPPSGSLYTPQGYEIACPLGAVVCTVVVADALPIVEGGALMRPKNTDRWLAQSWCQVGHPLAVVTRGSTVVDHEPTDQLPLGDFTPGRWGWMLTDPEPCKPVPCNGRQGVFELPDDVAGAIS